MSTGPNRNTTLPTDAAGRKTYPMATGLLDYFPDALAAVSHLSYIGNKQHNPDKPLHWDRSKSTDEADTLVRHLTQRGTLDVDGVRHSVKVAWRALALLQKELEAEPRQAPVENGCAPDPKPISVDGFCTGAVGVLSDELCRATFTTRDRCEIRWPAGIGWGGFRPACSLGYGHVGPHVSHVCHNVDNRVVAQWYGGTR